jgi:Rrf2 family nitric oxide-sensitive transcriptional repressor
MVRNINLTRLTFMHLKRYTDYSLRVLIYLGLHPERLVTIAEIAEGYQISKNHLMKIVKDLAAQGFVRSVKGKSGGLTLGKDPKSINIGEVVRKMESDFELVECLGNQNTCCILPACKLKPVLYEAGQRFLEALDPYTLEDVLTNRTVLLRLVSEGGKRVAHRPLK